MSPEDDGDFSQLTRQELFESAAASWRGSS
jgi:hypothetical protein